MFISRQEKYKRNDIIPSLTMTCLQASDAVAVARGEESAEVAATAAATTGGAAAAAVASEAAEETAAEAAASRTGSTAERGGATEEEDEDTGQTNKPKEAQVNDNVESEVDDALLIQDPKSESQ